jgi:hypothetical protein
MVYAFFGPVCRPKKSRWNQFITFLWTPSQTLNVKLTLLTRHPNTPFRHGAQWRRGYLNIFHPAYFCCYMWTVNMSCHQHHQILRKFKFHYFQSLIICVGNCQQRRANVWAVVNNEQGQRRAFFKVRRGIPNENGFQATRSKLKSNFSWTPENKKRIHLIFNTTFEIGRDIDRFRLLWTTLFSAP